MSTVKVTAGLILGGLLLFGASFNDPFHFDDTLITGDSNVTNPARWWHFLNPLHLRQLTFFSFYLNHLVGGLDPAGYHVVNVALHIANAVLLFLLASRFLDRWIAVVAAALFLVHPIQTQPVLYVYERSTLLACFFSLLALLFLSKRRTWMAVLFFFLAFESKETALAVPLALAVLGSTVGAVYDRPRSVSGDIAGGHRPPLQFIFVAVMVLVVVTLGLLQYLDEKTVGIGAADKISPLQYLLTQTRVIYTYSRLLVFPYPQSLEYEFPEPGGILAIAGVVAILAAAWWFRKTAAGLCILAFFILLAPSSSVIPSADAAFEHRLYLPMLAFSVLAAHFMARWKPVVVGVLIVLSILTVRRGNVWSSEIALWEDTVQHAPGKARVWFNLGGAYLNVDPEKARGAFLRTLELEPHFPQAYYNLGVIEQVKQNWSLALTYYGRAVEQDAAYWPAWNNMGNTLFAIGERQRALEHFETTLRLNPDYWPAQYNTAIVHFMSGRYREAEQKLRTVLDWRPESREARYLLAATLTRAGDRTSADVEWKKLGEIHAAESRITPTMILAPSRP